MDKLVFITVIFLTLTMSISTANGFIVRIINFLRNIFWKEPVDRSFNLKSRKIKYILQWDSDDTRMSQRQSKFIKHHCPYKNCYVTENRKYFDDITKFDVILFTGPKVLRFHPGTLPKKRSWHQKYVFSTKESSDNYPICSRILNRFFNWTWTYKLDSTVWWGYISIWDKNGNVAGPNKNIDWIKLEDMDPVGDYLKEQLKSKRKTAAWFVSKYRTRGKRDNYVKRLQGELKKYNLTVDVLSQSNNKDCSNFLTKECLNMVKSEYYFYLAFENWISEDFVTNNLLVALNNDAVPIVYGGADYTRFMPPGIYLNARKLGVKALAAKMDHLIRHPEAYAEYFKWKKYYIYRNTTNIPLRDEYCQICSLLNNKNKVEENTVIEDFRNWWDPPGRC